MLGFFPAHTVEAANAPDATAIATASYMASYHATVKAATAKVVDATAKTRSSNAAATANTAAIVNAASAKARNSNTVATANAADTTAKAPDPTNHPRDRLDVHVEKVIAAFKALTSWNDFVTSVRGRGDLHPGCKCVKKSDQLN